MCTLYQADLPADRQKTQELFTEYLQWVNYRVTQKLGGGFDIQAKVAEDMEQLQMFLPPQGHLVLAAVDSEVAVIGCLRTIAERVGEIKRMYVRPRVRRWGLRRRLMRHLIEQSAAMGHSVLRQNSAWFMEAAHALYHSSGFKEITPYPESEIPSEIHHLWVFVEKDLSQDLPVSRNTGAGVCGGPA